MTGGLHANQVARISPTSQHRLRLVCFPSSVLRNLQMQHQMRVAAQECLRPKSAWSGSSIIQDTCTKPDIDLSQTRFLWTHRPSAPSLSGQVTPAISSPNSGSVIVLAERALGCVGFCSEALNGGGAVRNVGAVCRKETSKCLVGTLFAQLRRQLDASVIA